MKVQIVVFMLTESDASRRVAWHG